MTKTEEEIRTCNSEHTVLSTTPVAVKLKIQEFYKGLGCVGTDNCCKKTNE